MNAQIKIVRISLRLENENDFEEDSVLIPVHDCYSTENIEEKCSNAYAHFYLRDCFNKYRDHASNSSLHTLLDPQLKVCLRNNILYYSDSRDPFLRRCEDSVRLYEYTCGQNTEKVIGLMEVFNLSM